MPALSRVKKWHFVSNWKMSYAPETYEVYKQFEKSLLGTSAQIVVCPSYVDVVEAIQQFENSDVISIGAQKASHYLQGAFTGEVSAPSLSRVGCRSVLVGHSERRRYFREEALELQLQLDHAFAAGLSPIFCVGELMYKEASNNPKERFQDLKTQLEIVLNSVTLSRSHLQRLVIGYEPVWAIGSGKSASLEYIQEALEAIAHYLEELFGEVAQDIACLYGGSVSDSNLENILNIKGCSGVLVGGASLKPEVLRAMLETFKVKVTQ